MFGGTGVPCLGVAAPSAKNPTFETMISLTGSGISMLDQPQMLLYNPPEVYTKPLSLGATYGRMNANFTKLGGLHY